MAFAARSARGADYRLGALALFGAIATILTALGFQYIGGYVPCMLCLIERYAYYAGIPVLFIALVLTAGGYRRMAALLFVLVALAFLANTGLGIYHAGAEWKFWPGPSACGGGESLTSSAGNLLNDIQHIKVIKCDEAALRFLGISFAGWNVVASVLLMAVAFGAASAAWTRRNI
ncbi:disulfide bond formation protein B [Hyphomicrobium sp. MC1]|uniref:disulfide bond formation protein B n=1 Tax=Hyphomicrobium sp. (strain MC1) TaxID=717785 RepID=UPI000213F022|nr:disulfide bond formation protein B [Hyphomicrobium sp. MC1]CCB67917.1 putative DsbB-like disulfide oxidoreductase precursor [Hyphomicrobium sp. MC1]